MSDAAAHAPAGRPQGRDLVDGVALFEGVPEAGREELSRMLRRRELPTGEVLWQQGDDAAGLHVILEGRVSASLRLPGDRAVAVAGLGPGELLGDIALLDGGHQPVTARVTEPATLLSLSRADFVALLARRDATAFVVKRRIAGVALARLRVQLAVLARSLGAAAAGPPQDHPEEPADLDYCGPPDHRYVRRLASFRAVDPLALWGFLTAGRFAQCPAGHVLVAEGVPSTACYLTMNGAVERVIVRGGRRIRVGLAGPGLGFGYESLIDGGPSPVTAVTRERTRLLVLPAEAFARLFDAETAGSHVFLDVVHRDLVAALRQALRPHARLAASV